MALLGPRGLPLSLLRRLYFSRNKHVPRQLSSKFGHTLDIVSRVPYPTRRQNERLLLRRLERARIATVGNHAAIFNFPVVSFERIKHCGTRCDDHVRFTKAVRHFTFVALPLRRRRFTMHGLPPRKYT